MKTQPIVNFTVILSLLRMFRLPLAILFFCISFYVLILHADTAKKPTDSVGAEIKGKPLKGLARVKQVIQKYADATLVTARIEKNVHLELLGEERKSFGGVHFSRGRVRMEIEKPEANLMIMGEDAIWLVNSVDKNLGGRTHVTKIRSKELKSKSRAPLAIMLSNPTAWDKFKVISEKKTDGVFHFLLKPKDEKALGEVTAVQLKISEEDNQLLELGYSDELENLTTYKFFDTTFTGAAKEGLFTYKPPRDAEVTVLE